LWRAHLRLEIEREVAAQGLRRALGLLEKPVTKAK
jgi:hypothetical protein